MEVILKGDPKEIAALVLAVQGRHDVEDERSCSLQIDGEKIAKVVISHPENRD